MTVFACGYSPRKRPELSKADAKAVKNFGEFLRGQGSRCCLCLHKAKKHDMSGCGAKNCECGDDNLQVLTRRKWAPAPGWKDD